MRLSDTYADPGINAVAVKDRRRCELKKQSARPRIAISNRGARIRTINIATLGQYQAHSKCEMVIAASEQLIDSGDASNKPRRHQRSAEASRQSFGQRHFGINRTTFISGLHSAYAHTAADEAQ